MWRNGKYYSVDVTGSIPDLKGNIDIKTPERNYDLDGRATIMMPHPERVFRTSQLSWAPQETLETLDSQQSE